MQDHETKGTTDTIVEEVRAARDAIAKESSYDLDKIVEAARERQARSRRRVVRLPPRRAIPIRKVS